MEDNFIKSYSNYVLKNKHQDVNNGYILERDITTIGGVDQFAKGQIPIYKSSNFIITVNNEIAPKRDLIDDGFNTWTENLLKNSTEIDEESNKIVVRQNFYKLKDFAYYGSCVELIRSSLNNILINYPGSLVSSENNVYYTKNGELEMLGDNGFIYLINNPSNINIHTKHIDEKKVENPIKYFANEGYKKYYKNITSYSVSPNLCGNKNISKKKGESIAEININNTKIRAYIGDEGRIYYLTNTKSNNVIAEPKIDVFNEFFNKLDTFERVLLNRNSTPKYTASFEVIDENDYGYDTEIRQFTFPMLDDYNLDFITPAYDEYVNNLYYYAKFYDELFCDNLYRSMTHESIKNFDWSYSRRYNKGDEEEYTIGGNKIKKLIRLFGREFDEIKTYIDGIKNYNNIEYGESSTMPEYFLNDSLINDGWDVVNIYPFSSSFTEITKLDGIKPYSQDVVGKGYYRLCGEVVQANGDKIIETDDSIVAKNLIRNFSSEKEYSLKEINKYFMKLFKLNSKSILSKKGTVEGIESLLSLFGLKSKRMNNDNFDYEIKEYVIKIKNKIEDKFDAVKKIRPIDWINSTKTVVYNTDDFRNGNYIPYQGLPIKGFLNDGTTIDGLNNEELNGKDVTLYPYFSYDKIIDGNPYYQMDGGWIKKSHKFINNDESNGEIMLSFDKNSYNETYRSINTVETLNELVELPISNLNNNDVFFVEKVFNCALIDGIIYNIKTDEVDKRYISSSIYNGLIKFGTRTFQDELTISDSNGNAFKYYLNDLPNGTEIKVYIKEDNTVIISGKYYSIGSFNIVEGDEENKSNYFELNNIYSKNKIGDDGWIRLTKDDVRLTEIKTIKDKFSGNNPHCGNLNYDGGYEYATYFSQLFKYPIENNLFNEECYNNFTDSFENIKTIGFEDLINDDCSLKLRNDEKIIEIKNDVENLLDNGTINVKNILISFNGNKLPEEIKYYDYVIMNYLEQLLPSTIISKINYNGDGSTCNVTGYTYDNYLIEIGMGNNIELNPTGETINLSPRLSVWKTPVGDECQLDSNKVYVSNVEWTVVSDNNNIKVNGTEITANINNTKKDIIANITISAKDLSNPNNQIDPFTITVIQPICKVTTDYTITIDNSNVILEKCDIDVTNNIVVTGIKTQTIQNGTTVEDREVLTNDKYTITYKPNIEKNETSDIKKYSFIITGNGKYKNCSVNGNITQKAGPCTISNNYDFSQAILSVNKNNNKMPACIGEYEEDSIITSVTIDNVHKRVEGGIEIVKLSDIVRIEEGKENPNYTITYSPYGNNQSTTDRIINATITMSNDYGNISKSGITINQIGGPCTECTCEISSIKISNAKSNFRDILETEFNESDTNKTFYVELIDDNNKCKKCSGKYSVFNGDIVIEKLKNLKVDRGDNGIGFFSISFDEIKNLESPLTLLVKSDDNAEKYCSLIINRSCTPSENYTHAEISFDAVSPMEWDSKTTTISNVKIIGIDGVSENCQPVTEKELLASEYEVSYNPSGKNETEKDRDVIITVKTNKYGNREISGTKKITQSHKPKDPVITYKSQRRLENGKYTSITYDKCGEDITSKLDSLVFEGRYQTYTDGVLTKDWTPWTKLTQYVEYEFVDKQYLIDNAKKPNESNIDEPLTIFGVRGIGVIYTGCENDKDEFKMYQEIGPCHPKYEEGYILDYTDAPKFELTTEDLTFKGDASDAVKYKQEVMVGKPINPINAQKIVTNHYIWQNSDGSTDSSRKKTEDTITDIYTITYDDFYNARIKLTSFTSNDDNINQHPNYVMIDPYDGNSNKSGAFFVIGMLGTNAEKNPFTDKERTFDYSLSYTHSDGNTYTGTLHIRQEASKPIDYTYLISCNKGSILRMNAGGSEYVQIKLEKFKNDYTSDSNPLNTFYPYKGECEYGTDITVSKPDSYGYCNIYVADSPELTGTHIVHFYFKTDDGEKVNYIEVYINEL